MVNEERLRAKVAGMRSGNTNVKIRVYTKRSQRQQRMAMTDVLALPRRDATGTTPRPKGGRA
jgi:hypothetical protein